MYTQTIQGHLSGPLSAFQFHLVFCELLRAHAKRSCQDSVIFNNR